MKLVLKAKLLFISSLALVALPFFVSAAQQINDTASFYVDSEYELDGKDEVTGILMEISDNAYFYVEDSWYRDLNAAERNDVKHNLTVLADEFDDNIYPQLTSIYGQEWKPGIDNDSKITVLLHQMQEKIAGYFRTVDEYRKIQAPTSNEKEMVYLNLSYINEEILSSYLAHEFTHLITFNQKNRLQQKEEDLWLNELRAEYAPTFLGYDDYHQESNLNKRLSVFISNPSDSLVEWKSEDRDYGVINVFAQYLVKEYGIEILVDSLRSPYVGIASLNYALKLHGVDKDMGEVFTDWAVAVLINDCQLGEQYCYQRESLKYLSIAPNLLYIPTTQEANMSLVYAIKQWSGHWYKIVGGGKGLELEFESLSGDKFNVAYLIKRDNKIEKVSFLELDDQGKGKIELPYFSQDNQSLIIVPTITSQISNFSENEPFWRFALDIKSIENGQNSNSDTSTGQMTPQQLKAKIIQVIALINEIKQLMGQEQVTCSSFNTNLYFGLRNSSEVKCLQQFLSDQDKDIYPEGLITGNFLTLTKEAVIRFQEKYRQDILEPLGLEHGTGYVGPKTREKINQLIK